MTVGPSIILPKRDFKLFSMRARPVAEASAVLANLMRGLLDGAQLKEPENHFRTHPSRIMLGLGVSHCDRPVCVERHHGAVWLQGGAP